MSLNKALIVIVLSLVVVAVPFRSAHATIFAQWVQLGSDGIASARAITDGDCPSVVFDGTDVPMTVRAEPAQPFGNVKPAEFPVRSCEVAVPQGAQTALLDGYALPLPRGNPRRILGGPFSIYRRATESAGQPLVGGRARPRADR